MKPSSFNARFILTARRKAILALTLVTLPIGLFFQNCSMAKTPQSSLLTSDQASSGGTYDPNAVTASAKKIVATGENSMCSLSVSGAVSCWGGNDYGQLGTGLIMGSDTPTQVIASGVKDLFGGNGNVCAIMENGIVKCWGGTVWALYGSTIRALYAPTDLSGTSFDEIAFGGDSFCMRTQGQVNCRGGNYYGNLGNGATSQYTGIESNAGNTSRPFASGVKSIVGSGYRYCALLEDSSVSCWGVNYQGQVGNGVSGSPVLTPVSVISGGVASLAASYGTVCALMKNADLKCWGGGNYSAGAANSGLAPQTLVTNVKSVQLSNATICALLNDGKLQCWGDNSQGQLSKDLPKAVSTPTTIQTGVNQFVILSGTTCYYKSGVRNCLGSNAWGQFGQGVATGPQPIQSLADYNAMQTGHSYYLNSDLDFGNAVVSKSAANIALDGRGFTIYNIGAKCDGTNCKVNSGRQNYVSALNFYSSDIKNLNLVFNGDVSGFPTDPTDMFFINLVSVSHSKLRNISVKATISGTLPNVTTTYKALFLSAFSGSTGSDIDGFKSEVVTNIAAPAGFSVSSSEISSVWTSNLVNSSFSHALRVHFLGSGGILTSSAVSSFNAGHVDRVNVTQNLYLTGEAGVVMKDISIYGTQTPTNGSSFTNSMITTTGNFTPNRVENISTVLGFSGSVFDKTGSAQTFTRTP